MFGFVYNEDSKMIAQLWYHDDFIFADAICLEMREQWQVLWIM
jgi:hypothetical protein